MSADAEGGPRPIERRTAVSIAGFGTDPGPARSALDDHAPTVRVAALRALARLGSIGDQDLAPALGDNDASVRITALELAARRTSPPIVSLLDDPEPMVVEAAAWALGERPGAEPATIDALVQAAEHHADPLAREAAVAALGSLGDRRGLAAILRATQDKPAVRRRAVVALAAFEGPEVDAAWARARTDRDRQVRDAVDELLGPIE